MGVLVASLRGRGRAPAKIDRPAVRPPEQPGKPRGEATKPGGELEVLQARVHFLQQQLTVAVNEFNNRLNAIRAAVSELDPSHLSAAELGSIEQIDAEIQRAADTTAHLLKRVDSLAPDAAPEAIRSIARLPAKPAHILVIDDDPSNRSVISRLFQRLGHLVTSVSNAFEAFEVVKQGQVDCIICDLRMPGLGGRSFYEQVEYQLPHLMRRFVFVTGDYTNPESSEFLKRSGQPAVPKPYEVESLLAAVAEVLSRAAIEEA